MRGRPLRAWIAGTAALALAAGAAHASPRIYTVAGTGKAGDLSTGRPATDSLAFTLGYADFRPTTSKSDTLLVGAAYARELGHLNRTLALTYQVEKFEVGVDEGTSNLLIPEISATHVVADDRTFTRRGHRAMRRSPSSRSRAGHRWSRPTQPRRPGSGFRRCRRRAARRCALTFPTSARTGIPST